VGHQGHKTGGRQKGIPNKRTQVRLEAAAEVIEAVGAVIPDAFAGDAHAFLVGIYKDPSQDPHTRRDALRKKQ